MNKYYSILFTLSIGIASQIPMQQNKGYSNYRSISSIIEIIQDKNEFIEKDLALACNQQDKINDLSDEIAKLEEERDKIKEILAELDEEKEEERKNKMSELEKEDLLARQLKQYTLINQTLRQKSENDYILSQFGVTEGPMIGDKVIYMPSQSRNSFQEKVRYASLVRRNSMALNEQTQMIWGEPSGFPYQDSINSYYLSPMLYSPNRNLNSLYYQGYGNFP
jgi:predicted nuclease with TOPRIM domain